MMTFAGHIGLALIVAYILRIDPVLTMAGAVLPDTDVVLSFFFPFEKVHRKFTHSLLFLLIFGMLSFFFPVLFPVVIGIVTHFIADLDKWGLPLFWPLSSRHYSLTRISHKHNLSSPQEGVLAWFKRRGPEFWLEWLLLGSGIFLFLK